MAAADGAKRVVSLQRAKAGWASLLKRREISQGEHDALVTQANAEIDAIRAQQELPLEAAKPAPKK